MLLYARFAAAIAHAGSGALASVWAQRTWRNDTDFAS